MLRPSTHAKIVQFGFLGCLGLLGLVALQPGAWAADSAHPYACVLNFERKAHPLSATLTKKLSDMQGVELVNEARPLDILKCLDEGATSVMIVGHAADLESESQVTAPLVYFRELRGEDRQRYLDRIRKQLDDEVTRFNEKVRTGTLKAGEGSYYYKVMALDQRIRKIPADQAVYDQPRLVENQIWKRVLSNPENLRKISIVSCLPEKVAAYYPELKQLQERGIEVEFGPINKFMSYFMGKNVASPDFDWMKKQLDESRPDPRVSNQEVKVLPSDPSQPQESSESSTSIGR